MNHLLQMLNITVLIYSAEATTDHSCSTFCAGEIKDPSKKLTFHRKCDLEKFNENFDGDEKFVCLSEGKCEYDEDCNQISESKICAIPAQGASGYPQTFRNFCDLNRHNNDNPTKEYLYYHDDCCNALEEPTQPKDKSNCSICDDSFKPVCAFPEDPIAAQPKTFPNYCWLKNFNCNNVDNILFYWHEGACYIEMEADSKTSTSETTS